MSCSSSTAVLLLRGNCTQILVVVFFFFFFLSCSPVVINLRVRQFEPEERFSLCVSNKVAMQPRRPSPSSQGGKGYFTWLCDECGVCGGASRLLAPSLSFLSITFFFYFITPLIHFPLRSSSHPAALSLSSSCFLPSALTVMHAECMARHFTTPPSLPFLNVSLSSSSPQRSSRRPGMKVTRWLSHGLQHRTWVLPVLLARVLCCSQWSRLAAADLSSSDPANRGPAGAAAHLWLGSPHQHSESDF